MMNQNRSNTPRVFHGPENICGIGRYLADWQREKKNAKADFIVFKDRTNRQNSHLNLHFENKNFVQRIVERISLLEKSLYKYDIFHFYFGKSFLPLNLDLPILKLAGKKMIMNYTGSDIRLGTIEKQRNPFFHLRKHGTKGEFPGFLKRLRMIWHSFFIDKFIVGPRLFAYAVTSIPAEKLIDDVWVNKTIFVPKIQPTFAKNIIPIIIHAPTNFHTKGTRYIQRAIDELSDEGLIFEFRICHKIPHDEFIQILINEADIVIDQLLSGGFGTLSMEGMAYGKPVCCYVTEDIWNRIPDLPIIQSTVDTLKDRLRELLLNTDMRKNVGIEGWNFSRKHFDRDITSEKLWQIYLKLWGNE